jgi:hypothetical protein
VHDSATEGGSYGLGVGSAFFFESGETFACWIAVDLCQHRMLKVVFPAVGVGVRHCLL